MKNLLCVALLGVPGLGAGNYHNQVDYAPLCNQSACKHPLGFNLHCRRTEGFATLGYPTQFTVGCENF